MKSPFPLFTIGIMLLIAACSAPQQSAEHSPQNIFIPDSLWTPTGDAELDSLLQLAAISPPDTNLAILYNDIGDIYLGFDIDKAKEYYLKLKALSEELNWSKGRYWYASSITEILNWQRDIDSSLVIHRQALELAQEENNELQIAKILSNIGNCYNFKQWYETALQYYLEALPLFEKQNEKYFLAQLYSLIGVIFDGMGMHKEWLEYSEKAVQLYEDNPDDLHRSGALVNCANAYISIKKLEKGEAMLLEALRITNLYNDYYNQMKIFSNLCEIALQKFDLDKVEEIDQKVVKYAEDIGDVNSYCVSNRGLSYVSMYRGDFNKSEAYLREVLETALEFEYPYEIMHAYGDLAKLYIAKHDFRNGREYDRLSDSVSKVITSEKTMLYAKEMEAKYETEKKQLEIEKQQTVIEKHTLQRRLFAGGIALCVVVVALLWVLLSLRTKRNKILKEKNEILDEMNATKNKFFSIISHDLKGPGIAQREAIGMLVNKAPQWDAATLQEYSRQMLHAADMQVELLNNLLSWAQLQSGRMACEPVPVDLVQTLTPILDLIRKIADAKGVAVETRFIASSPTQPLIATVDANMFSVVVRNLLANAVKFTATGGTVTLEVSPTSNLKSQISYRISVSDTGIGMSPAEVQDLFRLDRHYSRKGTSGETGTGLGLIVCKEMIEKHGSTLHIESEEGKGSRFWFGV